MKKRLLVLLLVVALAVTVSVFTATATEPEVVDNDPTDGTAYCYYCKKVVNTWTAFTTREFTTPGEHYHVYLADNVVDKYFSVNPGKTGDVPNEAITVCLHMNGMTYNYDDAENLQYLLLSTNYSSTLNIMDAPGSSSALYGRTYAGSSTASGCMGQMWNGSKVNLYNVDIINRGTNVTSAGSYGLWGGCFGLSGSGTTLSLYGDTTVQNGKCNNGGNVTLNSAGSVLNMYDDSKLMGGYAQESGGNIMIRNAAEVNIYGNAKVINGSSQYGAGGIGMTAGTLNIYGGEISGNRTKSGTATKQHGGNILVNGVDAKVNMSGGKVVGGFDLLTYTNGNVTLSGTAVIYGSDLAADATNGYKAMVGALVLDTTQRITLGKFETGAKVKVMFGTGSTATGAIASLPEGKQIRDFAPYIHGQYAWGNALYVNGSNELAMLGNCDAMINPADQTLAEATMIKYAYLTDALAEVNPATEIIYMKNVDAGTNADDRRTYNDPIVIDKDVTIDLNGVAITGTFQVAADKTLSLVDVTADDDFVNGPTSFVTVTGEGTLAKQTVHPKWNVNYIVLQDEDGVAVPHAFFAEVDMAYIKTADAAVYFGVTFQCDPVLAAQVEEFGMETHLASLPDNQFVTVEEDFAVDAEGKNVTTGVEIYDILVANPANLSNEERAAEDLVVTAYASFTNSADVFSAQVSYSLTDIMGLMNEKWNTISDQADIFGFYETWKTAANWNFDNIVAPSAAE